jgi:N-acetylneuraminate synthase/N,N'-diacetyllegionaminate synthase
MKIGNLDTDRKVLVIAEIGNNHEGSVSEAKKLVQAAAKAGADAVKFQTIVPKKLVSANQQERLQQLNRYALSPAHFLELHQEAVRAGVLFLSTPFDPDSVEFLKNLVPAFKIASGDSNYVELLEKIAATGKPVMVSTGLSDQEEKTRLRDFFHAAWRYGGQGHPGLALLHCVTEYPTPDERAGLQYLKSLVEMENITPGYSDHTLGIEAAVLAVGMGARIVEKHFTLDKTKQTFRDHALSADPVDFRALVGRIRRAEAFLAPVRRDEPPAAMAAARRSAAAQRDLKVGHTLQARDILWLRPGTGFIPGSEARLVGRVLARPVAEGILFSPEDFQA